MPTSSAYRPSRNGESAVRYLKLGNFSNLAFHTTINNKIPLLHLNSTIEVKENVRVLLPEELKYYYKYKGIPRGILAQQIR